MIRKLVLSLVLAVAVQSAALADHWQWVEVDWLTPMVWSTPVREAPMTIAFTLHTIKGPLFGAMEVQADDEYAGCWIWVANGTEWYDAFATVAWFPDTDVWDGSTGTVTIDGESSTLLGPNEYHHFGYLNLK